MADAEREALKKKLCDAINAWDVPGIRAAAAAPPPTCGCFASSRPRATADMLRDLKFRYELGPLGTAVYEGNVDAVKALLEIPGVAAAFLETDCGNTDDTPLQTAAVRPPVEKAPAIIAALVAAGAKVRVRPRRRAAGCSTWDPPRRGAADSWTAYICGFSRAHR